MTTLEILQDLLVRDYKVSPDAVVPQATLESLGVDSLGLLEMMFSVEERFGIKVPTERADLVTIDDVVRYIEELVAAQRSPAESPAEQSSGSSA